MLNEIDWTQISKMHVSMSAVLGLTVIFLLVLLYAWHRDSRSKIDLKDLICKNDRIDEKKFTRLGAWIVSTWGFIYLILDGKFTEWYFAGYMAIWVGNAIFDKYLNNRYTQSKTEENGEKL